MVSSGLIILKSIEPGKLETSHKIRLSRLAKLAHKWVHVKIGALRAIFSI